MMHSLPEGYRAVGLDINANHLKGVKSGWVTGTARPVHRGRTTQVWQIDMRNDAGECIGLLGIARDITQRKSQEAQLRASEEHFRLLAENTSDGMAIFEAGAIRFKPILLTALAAIIGAAVILTDPIFQGLAIALMAGEIASLLISRFADQ